MSATQGNFPTLASLVTAAQAETFTSWDASPGHNALYESKILHQDLITALEAVNVAEDVTNAVVAVVMHDPTIFKLQVRFPPPRRQPPVVAAALWRRGCCWSMLGLCWWQVDLLQGWGGMQTAKSKHGEATRIRYDFMGRVAGFSQVSHGPYRTGWRYCSYRASNGR